MEHLLDIVQKHPTHYQQHYPFEPNLVVFGRLVVVPVVLDLCMLTLSFQQELIDFDTFVVVLDVGALVQRFAVEYSYS